MINLSTTILDPLEPTQHKTLFIFLHGWGSNGNRLLHVGQKFQEKIPGAKCYFPNAPLPCELHAHEYAWFPTRDVATGNRFPNEILQNSIANAISTIKPWIGDIQNQEKVPPEHTYLIGFSQGAMMSLHLGLTYQGLVKGVIAYSGGLLGKTEWENVDTDVSYTLIHGRDDTIVLLDQFHFAKDVLEKHPLDYQGYIIDNLDHSINDQGIDYGIERVLASMETSRK
jgi:phospholipase/carboxylesterase